MLIFRPARRRGLGTATFLVAVTLGICAVVGLFGLVIMAPIPLTVIVNPVIEPLDADPDLFLLASEAKRIALAYLFVGLLVERKGLPTLLEALPGALPPDATLTVDLERNTLTLPDGTVISFSTPPFARHCLLHDIDEMQFLLGAGREIDDYEARHPASIDTLMVEAGA